MRTTALLDKTEKLFLKLAKMLGFFGPEKLSKTHDEIKKGKPERPKKVRRVKAQRRSLVLRQVNSDL